MGGDLGAFISSGASVLVLEGEAALRSALNNNFLRHGWQVKTVGSFVEAVRLLELRSFDLVLCGLSMRDGDLHAFLSAHRESMATTSVIVLASHASVTEVVQWMRSGADDVLARNCSLEQIQAAARAAVDSRQVKRNDRTESTQSASMQYTATPPPAGGMTLSELKRRCLEDALAVAGGNRTNAAKALGVSVRTVRNKIRQYGLPPRSYA